MDTGGEHADAARALADVDAIRRRVINVVGHALRTPITTMAGMAAALEHAEDDDTRQMLVEGLARNGRRVESLLDDLLIAAGVSTAVPVDAAEATSVAAAIAAAWADLGGGDGLHVEGDDVTVHVRPRVLERIVHVLLDNAQKYGHGPVTVHLATSGEHAEVRVESMGDGPNDEELLHVFELLYRGEHAVTAAPGLGIGLAVARELARADGGDVALEREGGAMVATVVLRR